MCALAADLTLSSNGESYKNVVKSTFAKGASLKDPARLFNSSLDGNTRRAIDIREGEEVDESAFKALVRQAAALEQFRQVESFEESEVLRDSAPEQVRHRTNSVKFRQLPNNNSFNPNPLRGSA